jgi:hypothetical protein
MKNVSAQTVELTCPFLEQGLSANGLLAVAVCSPYFQ